MDFLQKDVKVGSQTLKMPAFVTLMLGLAAAIGASYRGTNLIALYFLVLAFANTMTLNCIIDGHCNVWALIMFIGNVMLFGTGILTEIKISM
jgi:hypothetical protein